MKKNIAIDEVVESDGYQNMEWDFLPYWMRHYLAHHRNVNKFEAREIKNWNTMKPEDRFEYIKGLLK